MCICVCVCCVYMYTCMCVACGYEGRVEDEGAWCQPLSSMV